MIFIINTSEDFELEEISLTDRTLWLILRNIFTQTSYMEMMLASWSHCQFLTSLLIKSKPTLNSSIQRQQILSSCNKFLSLKLSSKVGFFLADLLEFRFAFSILFLVFVITVRTLILLIVIGLPLILLSSLSFTWLIEIFVIFIVDPSLYLGVIIFSLVLLLRSISLTRFSLFTS